MYFQILLYIYFSLSLYYEDLTCLNDENFYLGLETMRYFLQYFPGGGFGSI